jgi:hypothetical protein
MATTLKAELKTALDLNYNNPAEIQAIAAVGGASVGGPTKSIHVPFIKTGANYTEDSCITITTLLNQWDAYTNDHTVGAAGILSGYDTAGTGPLNMVPLLFSAIFGGVQPAYDALDLINRTAATQAIIPQGVMDLFNVQEVFRIPVAAATPGYAAAAVPDFHLGWSGILNRIAEYAVPVRCGQGEMLVPNGNQQNPPAPTDAAAAQVTDCTNPSELIRYAFGLLYKIKVVLGTDWPDTHNQLTMGGRNSKNNKRNKYTHRKKQYSQRRYKK